MTLFRVVVEHPDGEEREMALDRVLERIHDHVVVATSMGHTVRPKVVNVGVRQLR